jgi:hypothetical protein
MGFYILVLRRGKNMKIKERHDTKKQISNPHSQIVELGKHLGLDIEQIQFILNDTRHTTEHLCFSLGPPHYGAGFYGAISINDFDVSKT